MIIINAIVLGCECSDEIKKRGESVKIYTNLTNRYHFVIAMAIAKSDTFLFILCRLPLIAKTSRGNDKVKK